MSTKTKSTSAKETSLATPSAFIIPRMPADLMESLIDEMKGMPTLRLPVIKIPAGGATIFEIPTEDPNSPDNAKELVGVLVYHHSVNRYYSKPMGESTGEAPDCWSPDGEEGFTREGVHDKCQGCPLNEFGSDPKGGKACSNRRRLYVMFEGQFLPNIIEVPPASLKNLTPYIYANYAVRGRKTHEVLTLFTLQRATNKNNIVYSEIKFEFVEALSPATTEAAKAIGIDMKIRQGEEIANLCISHQAERIARNETTVM